MKPRKLTIENIGMIESEEINIDKSLLLFFGDILQGKSTILNSIKLLFGGSFPDDLIRHGEKEGLVKLEFDNGLISRSFYTNKKGTTIARPVSFILNNEPVKKPSEAIKSLLNPFLIDQDFLFKKNGLERQRYFIELFGIDTEKLDHDYKTLESEAKDLRSAIKAYGEIDLTPVDEPDLVALKIEKNTIHAKNQAIVDNEIKRREDHNKAQNKLQENIDRINTQIEEAGDTILKLDGDLKHFNAQLIVTQNTIKEKATRMSAIVKSKGELAVKLLESAEPSEILNLNLLLDKDCKSTEEIDEKISNAKADEVLFQAYQKNVARNNEKILTAERLKSKEASQRDIKADKIKLLASKSKDTGIEDFSFDEEGNARFQGTSMDMLSTSQVMNLSSFLSGLYPEGLGIELIDRAESLGQSIYNVINRAKEEDRTILATIVGDKPAKVSEDIGVFVVEGGKIK